MKLRPLIAAILVSCWVVSFGCATARQHREPVEAPKPPTSMQEAQSWLGQTGLVRWQAEPNPALVLPFVGLDGSVRLSNGGSLVVQLASAPCFGETEAGEPEVMIYRNKAVPYEDVVRDITIRYDVPAEFARLLAFNMRDHNGCFLGDLPRLLRDIVLTAPVIDPSIRTGWMVCGHGGGDGDDYMVGTIPLNIYLHNLSAAGVHFPDLFVIESCNPDGTTSIPGRLAGAGIWPARLAWTPNGYSTTGLEMLQVRRFILTEPADVLRPIEAQFGRDCLVGTIQQMLGQQDWTLTRVTIQPQVPVLVTLGCYRVAGVAMGLLQGSLAPARRLWLRGDAVTEPIVENVSGYRWCEF